MLRSRFFAAPLNELQMDAEEKEKEQSGETKARMKQQEKLMAHLRKKKLKKKKNYTEPATRKYAKQNQSVWKHKHWQENIFNTRGSTRTHTHLSHNG